MLCETKYLDDSRYWEELNGNTSVVYDHQGAIQDSSTRLRTEDASSITAMGKVYF